LSVKGSHIPDGTLLRLESAAGDDVALTQERANLRRVVCLLAALTLGQAAQAKEDPYAPPDPGVGTRYSRCCASGASYSSRYCGL